MVKASRYLLFLIGLAIVSCSDHGGVPSDFIAREVSVGGNTYAYRVFVPKERDPNKKLPVMLYLHGSGARGSDNVAQVDGFRWAIEPVKDKVDFIVVLPQCREETFWASSEMANYALAAP